MHVTVLLVLGLIKVPPLTSGNVDRQQSTPHFSLCSVCPTFFSLLSFAPRFFRHLSCLVCCRSQERELTRLRAALAERDERLKDSKEETRTARSALQVCSSDHPQQRLKTQLQLLTRKVYTALVTVELSLIPLLKNLKTN